MTTLARRYVGRPPPVGGACQGDSWWIFDEATDLLEYGVTEARNLRQPAVLDAIRICRHCPVKAECLEWALDNGERYGVLGGLTPGQRSLLRRRS